MLAENNINQAGPLIFIGEDEVRKRVSMREAIALMKEAFIALSSGEAIAPIRSQFDFCKPDGTALSMPGYLPHKHRYGIKIVMVRPENKTLNLPIIQGLMLVYDTSNGQLIGTVDAGALTALRTGAASGLATDLLARPDARIAAIFGAGIQGGTQLEAILAVRPIERVYIFDVDQVRCEAFCKEMVQAHGVDVLPATDPADLLHADVICTATTSSTPVFSHSMLKPGAHINGIGSFKPSMVEVPHDTVCAAKVIVDEREAALEEAGDLIVPIEKSLFKPEDIHAEIGEVAAGTATGRQTDQEITFFKSVGSAVQDIYVADYLLSNLNFNKEGA